MGKHKKYRSDKDEADTKKERKKSSKKTKVVPDGHWDSNMRQYSNNWIGKSDSDTRYCTVFKNILFYFLNLFS